MSKRKTRRRRRILAVGGIVCAATAVLVVIWSPWDTQTSASPSETPKAENTPKTPRVTNRNANPANEALKFPASPSAKPVLQAVSPDMKRLTIEMLKTEAFDVCREMQKDFPSRAAPLVLTADLHDKLGDHTNAAKLFREVLKLNPRRMDIYLYLADIAERKGDYEEAISQCRTALQLGSPPPGMYRGMGHCLLQLGKPREALDALQQEIRHFPKSAPYDLLGKAHLQLRQYKEAISSFERMLTIAPDDSSSYYGLATAWTRLGNSDKARKNREEFVELRQKRDEATKAKRKAFDETERIRRITAHVHTGASDMTYSRQQLDRTEKHLKRACDLDPEASLCRGKLVSLYLHQKRHAEALEICHQLTWMEPGDPLHYQNAGVLLSTMRRFPEAVDALRKGIAAAPRDPIGHRYLLKVLAQGSRNFAEAEITAQKLVRLEPTGANYYALSQACRANGNTKGAWKAIVRAYNLKPGNNRIRQAYLQLKTEVDKNKSEDNE